ncbi:MAG: DUF6252 family protein, partial [Bacteroidia bacterium]
TNYNYESIVFSFKNNGNQKYKLNLIDSTGMASAWFANYNTFWVTDSLTGGQVSLLKFDQLYQIVSGTFYFDGVKNKPPYDTIHITEGRFDYKYKQ